MSNPKILCALGGNALLQPKQKGTFEVQKENSRVSAHHLSKIVKSGYDLLLTHGNGPQVGAIYKQNELASAEVPQMPLFVNGAETQGFIGFMFAQEMASAFKEQGINKNVACIVSQSVVDKNDQAFKNPTNPVGRFLTYEEAEEAKKGGHSVMEDAGRGYRIVVPSPQPLRIVEEETIRTLYQNGTCVVACGGGGIPVIEEENGLRGISAVIDKDLCGSVLGLAMGVDVYMILTDVECVMLDYNKPTQRNVSKMTVAEARKFASEGQFGKGSMGPKVEAACRFAEQTGKKAIIACLDKAVDALAGNSGTHITL